MIKLFDYQKEIISSEEKAIMLNWSRGNGKTWTIANLIKEKKPAEVIWVSLNGSKLRELNEAINNLIHLDDDFKNSIHAIKFASDKIRINYKNVAYETTIRSLKEHEIIINEDKVSYKKRTNYLVYDNCFPLNTIYTPDKTICTITTNNYDKHLQEQFPSFHIDERDYRVALSNNLLLERHINNIKEENKDLFFKEYAILDCPYSNVNNALETFVDKTISELIYEYERTSKSNNTVLTRKNIIEMISYLSKIK